MLDKIARFLENRRVWHRWPLPVSIVAVLGLRDILRKENLHSLQRRPLNPSPPNGLDVKEARTADGSFNDLSQPWMGMKGARVGRNVPPDQGHGEEPPRLFTPSPRLVSNLLMARRELVAVEHLNVLAAAWIQFMVHDWVSHGSNDKARKWHVPLPEGDDWPEGEMTVLHTTQDIPGCDEDRKPPHVYTNVETSWWDASQIYGSDEDRQRLVRTDPETGQVLENGKLFLQADGSLPIEGSTSRGKASPGLELAGVNGNWWIGLSVLHRLFAQEHNAIVDRLHVEYPDASGEWLFQKARLVNAALLARIHTIEWTPALMNSPVGRTAMRGNYFGILGEDFGKRFGRYGSDEVLSGIPGSPTDHHGTPYAMTEEFASVYRMHSLVPDDFHFRQHRTDSSLLKTDLRAVSGGDARGIHDQITFDDVVYSLCTEHPGLLCLHNFPNALRRIDRLDSEGVHLDLATVDILRDRERGVPRYCRFRKLLGMRVPERFEDLTDNSEDVALLQQVYEQVEDVDLQIGMMCEAGKKQDGFPPGFGFSDTAFRIFILMASRRLKSDRFFTSDFRPEIYTQAGYDWVVNNGMADVLRRHCPALQPHFEGLTNVFFPWQKGAG